MNSTENVNPGEMVVITTPLGDIEVELAWKAAPLTTANFLHYVDGGLYNGGRFHRTVTRENQSNANLERDRVGLASQGRNQTRRVCPTMPS